MRRLAALALAALLAFSTTPAFAKRSSGTRSTTKTRTSAVNPKKVQVKSSTRKDGTKVKAHVRSAPNKTKSDNLKPKKD